MRRGCGSGVRSRCRASGIWVHPPRPLVWFKNRGTKFRVVVESLASVNQVPMVRFVKTDRKIDVMRPLCDKAARAGRWSIGSWVIWLPVLGGSMVRFTCAGVLGYGAVVS